MNMANIPNYIELANLPTKIEKLDRLSKDLGGPSIYIKRDDQTGNEISGNKIRKLEFVVKEAIDQGCNLLITCGGIQSNHTRATAAVAAKLGISSYLVLRGSEDDEVEGNYFLDKLLGAEIKLITPQEYKDRRTEIMEEIKDKMIKNGYKPYIIPEGASNGLGTFGYYKAMSEIAKQEKELGIKFDTIVVSVGSGGTYSGLFLANKILKRNTQVFGINICDNSEHFRDVICNILNESIDYIEENLEFSRDEINIIDGYVGNGYALSRTEELEFIYEFSRKQGIILDPVYTGKAMYGLVEEIKKGKFKESKNILFIHTGGLYGLFPKKDLFVF
jgi:D-cysteine desulfhydrase